MGMRWATVLVLVSSACVFDFEDVGNTIDEDEEGDGDGIAYVAVSGTVADLVTGEPVADLTVGGIDLIGSQIEVDASSFAINQVLPHSVFRLRIASPTHATTISALIEVGESDATGLLIEVAPVTMVDAVYTEVGIFPKGGVLLYRLRRLQTGTPQDGVPRAAFPLGELTVFADDDYVAAFATPATTASGVAISLNIVPGIHEIESAVPDHQFLAADARIEDSVVSVVDVEVAPP